MFSPEVSSEDAVAAPLETPVVLPSENAAPFPPEDTVVLPAENAAPFPPENAVVLPSEDTAVSPSEDAVAPPSEDAVALPSEDTVALPLEHVVVSEEKVSAPRPSGFSFYGLYPLWEGTGNVVGHRRAFIGNNWASFGFAQRFSFGLRPMSFFFRVPNAEFKALVYARDNLKVSMQLSPSLVLPGASASFTSSNFVSRFDDNQHALWLLPLSANASWQILEELCLHASLTALGAFGKRVPNLQVTLGLTAFAEFMAWENHSLLFHLGEIGFWRHDLVMLGASYRFHWKWIEAQLGYFYRFSPDGNQGGPLIALGVLL